MYNLKCYLHSIKLYLKSIMVFKGSLPLFFLGLLVLYFTGFAGILIIMNRFKLIGYWSFGQIIFIYTLSLISYGIRNLFFFQFRLLGDMVKRGELDRYLVRPTNPVISIMGLRMELGGLVHIILGICILIFYRNDIGVLWNVPNTIWLILVIVAGAAVQGGITVVIGTMAFYLGDTRGLDQVYNSFREFIWYPISLYDKVIQFFLTFIIPLGFASFFPAGIFLRNEFYNSVPVYVWKLSLLINLFILFSSIQFFHHGMKRYTSTGS